MPASMRRVSPALSTLPSQPSGPRLSGDDHRPGPRHGALSGDRAARRRGPDRSGPRLFRESEQIPTRIRMAAGPLMIRGTRAESWRAGAIMVQHLPREGGASPLPVHSGDAPDGEEQPQENDDWVKARLLLDTAEAHELLDPQLSPEQLLYRLYHEDVSRPIRQRRWRAIAAARKPRSSRCSRAFRSPTRQTWSTTGKLR